MLTGRPQGTPSGVYQCQHIVLKNICTRREPG